MWLCCTDSKDRQGEEGFNPSQQGPLYSQAVHQGRLSHPCAEKPQVDQPAGCREGCLAVCKTRAERVRDTMHISRNCCMYSIADDCHLGSDYYTSMKSCKMPVKGLSKNMLIWSHSHVWGSLKSILLLAIQDAQWYPVRICIDP
jgi:hypothetical protein